MLYLVNVVYVYRAITSPEIVWSLGNEVNELPIAKYNTVEWIEKLMRYSVCEVRLGNSEILPPSW